MCADDYDDRRRDVYESPADKLKTAIIKFGEVVSVRVVLCYLCSTQLRSKDVLEELPLIETKIREFTPLVISNLSEAFRIGCVLRCMGRKSTQSFFCSVTEQPFKIPYYAALLRRLHDSTEETSAVDGPSLGKQILEDFWKGFQAYLDKLAWRETRLCVSIDFSANTP